MALEIKATLRVYSKKHTLCELINMLGEPSKGFSIGDKFSKGRKTRDHTYWSYDSSNIEPKKSFENHLVEVLNSFESKRARFQKLRNEECELDITCMFYTDNGQGGATLSSESMGKLNQLGLNLVFDVYADCE